MIGYVIYSQDSYHEICYPEILGITLDKDVAKSKVTELEEQRDKHNEKCQEYLDKFRELNCMSKQNKITEAELTNQLNELRKICKNIHKNRDEYFYYEVEIFK